MNFSNFFSPKDIIVVLFLILISSATLIDGLIVLKKKNPISNTSQANQQQQSTESTKTAQVPDQATPLQMDPDTKFRSSTWFSDYQAMRDTVMYYNEIHPFIYLMEGRLNNTGKLSTVWSRPKIAERIAELRALNPRVKIIPTIFRWENKGEKIAENIGMNGRSDIRKKHIEIILNEIETYNFDGIDIDYEGMSCEKKEKFEEFIVLLSKELKKRNKILSVAVHPKTEIKKSKMISCKGLKNEVLQDFAENWRGPLTHDYEFLAKHVDRVKIMAYELHPRKYHNPGPGPQAPNVWLENIIQYAEKRIPHEKLYMAIPTYGYDWALNCKARAKAVYFSDAERIKGISFSHHQPTNIPKIFAKHERSKSWKNLSKFMYIHEKKVYEDPSLWYKSEGCDRVAFYMNRLAFEKKMDLLRSYNIAGFSFWQLLRDNDPQINDYLGKLVSNQLPPVPLAEKKVLEMEQKLEEEQKKLEEEQKKLDEKTKQIANQPENKSQVEQKK